MELIAVAISVNIGPSIADPFKWDWVTHSITGCMGSHFMGSTQDFLEGIPTPLVHIPAGLLTAEVTVFGADVIFFAFEDNAFKFGV